MHVMQQPIFFDLTPFVTGLIGVIAGLAMRKFPNFREPRNILKAIGFYLILNTLTTIIAEAINDYYYFGYIFKSQLISSELIIPSILGSIFLAILMIAFAEVVRPNQGTKE